MSVIRRTRLCLLALTTTVALGGFALAAPTLVSAASQTTSSAPTFNPANFAGGPVDNPWFPLTPGTTLVYRGTKDGKSGTDIFHVLHRRHEVGGVSAVVVEDTTVLAGRLSEHTFDYYAQDVHGNVWYLGERTAEYDRRGNVTSTEGSWATGVDGAQPGIFMPAHPQVGDTYRQEYYPGHAEDHFAVTNLNASVQTPYGAFNHAMRTREWTPLEPGTRDAKFYVKGIGEVTEMAVRGPKEVFRLEQVITE
jgi:hypothetical protein